MESMDEDKNIAKSSQKDKLYAINKDKKSDATLAIAIIDGTKVLLKNELIHRMFTWIKNNISIVLILISGIGALLQVYELSKIHVSYIKFFSVTQFIADGALVSVLIIVFAIMFFSTILLINKYMITRSIHKYIFSDSGTIIKAKLMEAIIPLLTLVLLTPYVFDTMSNFNPHFETSFLKEQPFSYLIFAAFYLAMIVQALELVWVLLRVLKSYEGRVLIKFKILEFDTKIAIKLFLRLSFLCLSVYTIIGLIKIPPSIYDSVRLPHNMINEEFLKNRVALDYSDIDTKRYNLVYYNDTYTFIEIKQSEGKYNPNLSKVIAVYKTDEILFSPSSHNVYIKSD